MDSKTDEQMEKKSVEDDQLDHDHDNSLSVISHSRVASYKDPIVSHRRMHLLSYGYLRQHEVNPTNIGDVLAIYTGCQACPIRFHYITVKGGGKDNSKDVSTVYKHSQWVHCVITPELSSHSNDKNIEVHPKFEFVNSNCNHDYYKNGGYNFMCGVIKLKKSKNDNGTKDSEDKKDHKDNQDNKNIKTQKNVTKMAIEQIRKKYDSDKGVQTIPLHYYIFMRHVPAWKSYFCSIGLDNVKNYVMLYNGKEYNEEFCLKKGDWIDICFESKKEEMSNYTEEEKESFYSRHGYDYQQNIYFLKNSKTIIGKNINSKGVNFGKMTLDPRYAYYAVCGSSNCDCQTATGFEYNVRVFEQLNSK